MSNDLIEQLASYGRFHEEQQEPLQSPSSEAYLVHASKHSKRPIRLPGKPWAFVAGVVAVLAVGSLALLLNSGPPTNGFEASNLNVTAREWFDQTISASDPLDESETVLIGSAGPAPEFDTSDLGNEQPLEPVDTDILEWAPISEDLALPGPLILAGVIPGVLDQVGEPIVLGLAKGNVDLAGGAVVCNVEVSPIGYSRGCHAELDPMEFGATGLTVPTGGQAHVLTIQVPAGSSVVSIEHSGDFSWQRPIANLAAFVGTFNETPVTVTIYSKDGTVINRSTGSPLS